MERLFGFVAAGDALQRGLLTERKHRVLCCLNPRRVVSRVSRTVCGIGRWRTVQVSA